MNKKILSLLLCLAMVFTILPAAASADADPAEQTAETPAATEIIGEPSPSESTPPAESTPPTAEDEVGEGQPAPEDKSEEPDPANPTDIAEEKGDAEEPVEDEASLYEQLMACTEFEAAQALIEALTEEERKAFLDGLSEEEYAALDHHIDALQPAAEPFEPISVIAASGVAPFLPAVNGTAVTKSVRALRSVSALGASVTSLSEEPKGLIVNKTAAPNGDGTYKISLEAFVTGAVTSSTVTTDVPADIVLVLDVSGSMDDYITAATGAGALSSLDTQYGGGEGVYIANFIDYGRDYSLRYSGGQWQFYSKSSGWTNIDGSGRTISLIKIKKIDALKISVQNFIDSVYTKSLGKDGTAGTADDVDHKIAIVKFAGTKTATVGNDVYNGGDNYNYTQIMKTLSSAKTEAASMKSLITSISAGGATSADYGMQHAATILSGIPTSRKSSQVVVMFTDGEPNHQSGFDTNVANAAISESKGIKANGATVYTIGVFNGANDSKISESGTISDMNRYMHYVSSNFKNAQSMTNAGDPTYPTSGSYYLAASNSAALNSLFQQISQNIQSGEASVKLGTDALVKDVVTQYFDMPANTSDVSVKSYDCLTYDDATGAATWAATGAAISGAVSFTGNTINVSGFDYTRNFVAKNGRVEGDATQVGTFHGRKLVVTFNVTPKSGFWGGNGVPTNEATSGVYVNATTATVLKAFPVPTVDVTIRIPAFTGNTADVFYGASAPNASALYTAIPLPGWEDDFVNEPTYGVAPALSTTADGTYTVTATATPKTGAGSGTSSTTANIRVFKPTVTWVDSTRYYGDTFPTTFTPSSVVWKHGDEAAAIGMGAEPTLSYVFGSGGISTMPNRDVYVSVNTKLGDTDITPVTTYLHEACTVSGCSFNSANGRFLVHPLTCSLTVAKTAAAADANQYFIVNVLKPDNSTIKIAVKANGSQKIVGLPIGTYTVNEAEDWSWRFTDGDGRETLSSTNPNGSIGLTNALNNDKWLSGVAAAVNRWTGGIVSAVKGGGAA